MNKWLFLDVDGVINPLKKKASYGEISVLPETFTDTVMAGISVVYSPPIKAFVNEILDAGYELVWATTWCMIPESLAEYAELYGLPWDKKITQSYRELSDSGILIPYGECGKLQGIQLWCEQNDVQLGTDKIIWIDDDMGDADVKWAKPLNICAVRPNSMSGLRDVNAITKIRKYINGI